MCLNKTAGWSLLCRPEDTAQGFDSRRYPPESSCKPSRALTFRALSVRGSHSTHTKMHGRALFQSQKIHIIPFFPNFYSITFPHRLLS